MERNYRILEEPAVEDMMKEIIDKVKAVTNVIIKFFCLFTIFKKIFLQFSTVTIRAFLKQLNWEVERFFEEFTEDYDNFFRKYKIFDREVIATDIKECCEICFDTAEFAFHGCRHHHLCESCLSSYLTIKINDEMESDVIKCPGFKCNFLIEDGLIKQLITAETYKKYQRRILENFISRHIKLQKCPGLDCNFIIFLLDSKIPSSIVCLCGHEFCFHCDFETSHSPLPCKMIKEWTSLLLRFGKTPASTEWIQKNTKPCPKCKRPILKHTGCDHMHCTQCGLNFNWSNVSTHISKTPFFVPSETQTVEYKIPEKRQKLSNKEETYDLQKIDTCTTKYVAALAVYREKPPKECDSNMEVIGAIKALKKCNHLLIVSAILEFFTKDEKLVFFMYHEYELQQRAMELEKAVQAKLKTPEKYKKWKRKSNSEVSTPMNINDLLM